MRLGTMLPGRHPVKADKSQTQEAILPEYQLNTCHGREDDADFE